MTARIPNVLSIAGSDPSGGAGIQADLKTFAALDVYGCAAITALTAQNTKGVRSILGVPGEFMWAQLAAVFEDIRVDAVKVGMLGSADVAQTVASVLRAFRPPIVVLDPVLKSSTGQALLEENALKIFLDSMLPVASLVTPNVAEAGMLLGRRAPRTIGEAHQAARDLVQRGARAVLVTGGHLADVDVNVSVDVLHQADGSWESRVSREPTGNGTHGTGCTLSSAIAALLAKGRDLPTACAEAQQFVAESIRASSALRVGHGRVPVYQTASPAGRATSDGPLSFKAR